MSRSPWPDPCLMASQCCSRAASRQVGCVHGTLVDDTECSSTVTSTELVTVPFHRRHKGRWSPKLRKVDCSPAAS